MSGENKSANSPLQQKSCRSTPEDITATFNSNQFWSYPFHNTEHLLPKTMNNSITISNAKTEEAANNNDIIVQQEDIVSHKVKTSSKPNENVNKKENAPNHVKTVTVPTNFNSLNELTEEELLILIEDRRKAAAAAEINIVPILSDGGYSRKSTPAVNSEYSGSAKGSRRVSDTHAIKQDAALDMRRKSLPSSKNFLQGFLQNFVLSGRRETSPQSPVETIKEEVNAGQSPNMNQEIISKSSPIENENGRQSPNINREVIAKPSPIGNHNARLSPNINREVIAKPSPIGNHNARLSPNINREVISKPSPIGNQNSRQSPIMNQESPIDLTVKHADLSSDEEVRAINAAVLQMEISPDRDQDNNSSLNRTPVASGCNRGHSRAKLAKTAAGTPKSNTVVNDKPRSTVSSPELQYPTDKDFGYVSPIPVNERFNGTLTYSDSPKRSIQSPILSCSFTDPTYQYVSDNSDNGTDSSFERDFEPDLMSFEDPALEKSPFVKYTVELRAKLAARISGDGPCKPSPFLFSPRNSSNPKVYIPANDRHLHFLQEETTLDFENNDNVEMVPQEEHENEAESSKEIEVVGTVTEVSSESVAPVESSDIKDNENELGSGDGVAVLEKSFSKKTVWAQLVENIELHIIRGNKAGFIACLNGHSFPCV